MHHVHSPAPSRAAQERRGRGLALCAGLAGFMLAGAASAAGVYAGIGLPGVVFGLTVPVAENVTLRTDSSSMGTRTTSRVESGISYDARLKTDRIGAFVDWFPFSGRFRLTAGVTSNDFKAQLGAFGTGRVLTIGSNSYTLGANDRFDANVAFPRATPYLGIGWGHRGGPKGLGLHADIGMSMGRPSVSTRASGNLAQALTIAADAAQEEAQLREALRRIRGVPQVSVGVDYRF